MLQVGAKRGGALLQVPVNLAEHPRLDDAPEEAFRQAMLKTNEQLHASSVDDSMSGTTAITCLLRGRQAIISNVGDSRAIIAEKRGDSLAAIPLSRDQTPFRCAGRPAQLRCGSVAAAWLSPCSVMQEG